MALFSASYHIAGLRGLPRRVYSASLAGDQGAAWQDLTRVAAIGSVILFASALVYVGVVIGTWVGPKVTAPPLEFAEPLRPETGSNLWDRFGLWATVAAVLVLIAYAYPLYQLLSHPRFGSPPFQPF
jgi:cytochrome c oxidase subunit 1